MDENLIAAYLEENNIILPERLIQDIAERAAFDILYNSRYERMITGNVYSKEEYDSLTEDVRARAYAYARNQLFLQEVIRVEELEVGEEELVEEIYALADRLRMPVEKVHEFLGENLGFVEEDLLMRKAEAYILSTYQ